MVLSILELMERVRLEQKIVSCSVMMKLIERFSTTTSQTTTLSVLELVFELVLSSKP